MFQGAQGQSVVTAQTSVTASAQTLYNLKTEHYLLPPCGISNCSYRNDYFNYYYSSPNAYYGAPSEFGQTQTIYACNPYPYSVCYADLVYGWIWMGNTNAAITTPPTVTITNPRISGNLSGTMQNGLVGADITLNAVPSPSGGTYSWTFTGPYSISLGSTSSSSVTIRSTEVGTMTARVNYTRNGATVTAVVTINSVLPSLTNFTAQQGSDLVAPPDQCKSDTFWWYKLGCPKNGQIGMNFTSSVHAPTFISDPSQSGIKYVQAVSAFRKKNRVGTRCDTRRSSESDVASGWQVDTEDPYVFIPEFPVHRFTEGNDLTMLTVDNPGEAVTFILAKEFIDVLSIDDRFEMYVVYFTGDEKAPGFQRPLGKLAWNWGGLGGIRMEWLRCRPPRQVLQCPTRPTNRHSNQLNGYDAGSARSPGRSLPGRSAAHKQQYR